MCINLVTLCNIPPIIVNLPRSCLLFYVFCHTEWFLYTVPHRHTWVTLDITHFAGVIATKLSLHALFITTVCVVCGAKCVCSKVALYCVRELCD